MGFPLSGKPAAVEPGMPTALSTSLSAKDAAGKQSITVSWNPPKTPWHNIPCNGSKTSPGNCPNLIADGGNRIKSYQVDYDTDISFQSTNSRHIDIKADSTIVDNTYKVTIDNVLPNNKYYIRVFAKNDVGYGPSTAPKDLSTP